MFHERPCALILIKRYNRGHPYAIYNSKLCKASRCLTSNHQHTLSFNRITVLSGQLCYAIEPSIVEEIVNNIRVRL